MAMTIPKPARMRIENTLCSTKILLQNPEGVKGQIQTVTSLSRSSGAQSNQALPDTTDLDRMKITVLGVLL